MTEIEKMFENAGLIKRGFSFNGELPTIKITPYFTTEKQLKINHKKSAELHIQCNSAVFFYINFNLIVLLYFLANSIIDFVPLLLPSQKQIR